MLVISTRLHANFDYGVGIALVAAPWILGFASYVYTPHLVIGLAELVIATMTIRQPFLSYIRGKADLSHSV
jgi:hypothetical protein